MPQRTNQQVIHWLRQATMAMRAAFRLALADIELTPQQNTVLHLVSSEPGSSSAELARRTHVTAQTMHKIVAELVDRGLLTLDPRPSHGRILEASLTDPGRKLLDKADARGQIIEDQMTAGLDQPQRQQLVDLLQHCAEALGTELQTRDGIDK